MDWFKVVKAYNREHYVKAGRKHNDEETVKRHTKILEQVARSPVKNKKMGRSIRRIAQNQTELSSENKSTNDIKQDVEAFRYELDEMEMKFAKFNRWRFFEVNPEMQRGLRPVLDSAQDDCEQNNRIFNRTVRPITDAIHYKTQMPTVNLAEMYNMVSEIRRLYKTPQELIEEYIESLPAKLSIKNEE